MSMDEVPKELYQEFMGDISDEIDRESKIIDDLLSLVKMDKSEAELNITQVNLNVLVEQILKRLRPIANRRKVELKLNGIGQAEARRILQEYRVEADAAAALAAIAADVKRGGMGTFVEILELCLEAAEGGPITAEILKSAKKYKLMY